MKHFTSPSYKGLISNAKAISKKQINTTCADELDLHLLVNVNLIEKAQFTKEACAIATSSADLICQTITNKNILQAIDILKSYEAMIMQKEYDSSLIEQLNVFSNIKKHLNRTSCHLLASNGFLQMLQDLMSNTNEW